MDSHLQAVAVQVTLGDTPVTILSTFQPTTTSHLEIWHIWPTNIRGQILITGDFNGHSYLWGTHDVNTRGEVIERFTNKQNLCILNDGTHTYMRPQAQHVNKPTSAIDIHTRTCSEKCVGGAAVYPWQLPLSHTDFDPTISGRDTTKLWSFPLGFFQGQLGTVSWCVFGKHLWWYTRRGRFLTLLCRAHNQGRKWLHPKGNHQPQEVKPLVWWRMQGSPEG